MNRTPQRPDGYAWARLLAAWAGILAASYVSAVIGGAAVGLFLVVLISRGRHEEVLLTLLLIFFLADSRQPELRALKDLRYVVIVLAGLYACFAFGRGRWLDRRVAAFIPFVAVALLATVHSPAPADALLKTTSYLLLILVVFQYLLPTLRERPERLLSGVVILFCGLLLVGLLLIPVAPRVVFMLEAEARFRGLLGNPNGLGIFCTLFLPLAVLFFERVRPDLRGLKWVCIGMVLASMVLAGSRNALTAVALFLALYYGLSGTPVRRSLVVGIVAPLTIVVLATVPMEEMVRAAGLDNYLRIEGIEGGSGRTAAWAYAMERIQEAPLLGRGFDFDSHIFDRTSLETAGANLGGHQGGVHNSYLAFVLNTGILGLIAFGWFLVRVFRGLGPEPFLLALLGAALVSATFEAWLMSSLNAYTIIFFLNLAALLALRSGDGSGMAAGWALDEHPARLSDRASGVPAASLTHSVGPT